MEAYLPTLFTQKYYPSPNSPLKPIKISSNTKPLTGFCNPKVVITSRSRRVYMCRVSPSVDLNIEEDQNDPIWKLQFLGEVSTSTAPKKKPKDTSRLLKDTDSMDWCVRARRVALQSLEERGLAHTVEKMVASKQKKKKKKKSKKIKGSKNEMRSKKKNSEESDYEFEEDVDVGSGRDVNLDKCPRANLQRQCIQYLGPNEREAYQVVVDGGRLVYKQSEVPVNTVEGSKWIFVLSTSRALYVGQKKKGSFQHSSFLAGGATTAAGRMVVKEGVLKAIWPYSGHYLPTEENFMEFISFLQDNHVDLSNVKRCSVDDDEFPSFRKAGEGETASDVAKAVELAIRALTPKANDGKPGAFELGRRLSCKWSTGAGPRIGCVRDYPAELQSRALEQVNLSPRVVPSPAGNRIPIPSPRPSPGVRLSPRLAYMGFPTPTVRLTLPKFRN